MTRAKDRLVLSRALKRLWRGRVHAHEPSPFLADIESELVKEQRSSCGTKREDRQLKLFQGPRGSSPPATHVPMPMSMRPERLRPTADRIRRASRQRAHRRRGGSLLGSLV